MDLFGRARRVRAVVCPKCKTRLVWTRAGALVLWRCAACQGRATNLTVLRRTVAREAVNQLWGRVREGKGVKGKPCPSCERPMLEVSGGPEEGGVRLDVCRACEFVWFDAAEFETLPAAPVPAKADDELSPKAREQLAILRVQQIAREAEGGDWGADAPEEWWKVLPALLGMPIEYEAPAIARLPWLTFGLAAAVTLVSVWAFFDLENVIHQYGLIPAQAGRYGGFTLLSSFFLHVGAFHLVGNMYFLLVFGDNVEDCLGRWRYAGLLWVATVAAGALHVAVDPASEVPCVGASGGISGVLVFYALAFPRARLGFLVRYWVYFRWLRMPAYAALVLWILYQLVGAYFQVSGLASVSFVAHLGGAGTGAVWWLLWRGGQRGWFQGRASGAKAGAA